MNKTFLKNNSKNMKVRTLLILLLVGLVVVPVGATTNVFYTNTNSDGRLVRSTSAVWATIRAGAGTAIVNTTAQLNLTYVSTAGVSEFNGIPRYGFCVDTSTIPDDSIINSAIFGTYGAGKGAELEDINLALTGFNPTNPAVLAFSDYNKFVDGDLADQIPYASISTTGYNNFTLNSAGLSNISKTGYTCVAMRTHFDANNSAPGWIVSKLSWYNGYDSSQAGTDKDPFLEVTYSSATTPTAAFTANTTSGTAPLAVAFTDESTNTPTSWNWSFGDGNWTNGTTQNATHLYAGLGTFNAFLIASNEAGSNQSANTTITTNDGSAIAPVAAFTKNRVIISIPQPIILTDTSTNTPTDWQWDMGDGSENITTEDVAYRYSRMGFFTIDLTSSNAAGESYASTNVWVRNPLYMLQPKEKVYSCEFMTYSTSKDLNSKERLNTDEKIVNLCGGLYGN